MTTRGASLARSSGLRLASTLATRDLRGGPPRMNARRLVPSVVALLLGAAVLTFIPGQAAAFSASVLVQSPVNVTNDAFAENEESLGMDPTGTLLASAWNDWNYND